MKFGGGEAKDGAVDLVKAFGGKIGDLCSDEFVGVGEMSENRGREVSRLPSSSLRVPKVRCGVLRARGV